MELIQASTMGFCSGVSRAIKKVKHCLLLAEERGLPAYSYGKFIHNQQVLDTYLQQGLQIIDDPYGQKPGCVVIRAHGISDALRNQFIQAGYEIIDGTCPTVARSQRLIRQGAQSGRHILIVGIPGHDETVALAGCEVNGELVSSTIIDSEDDFDDVPDDVPLLVMTQTTYPEEPCRQIHSRIDNRFGARSLVYGNWICPSSTVRCDAVRKLCDYCDSVLVIGSKMSANTNALVDIVRSNDIPVWLVETEADVTDQMCRYEVIGITAGASTSPEMIERVKLQILTMHEVAERNKDNE